MGLATLPGGIARCCDDRSSGLPESGSAQCCQLDIVIVCSNCLCHRTSGRAGILPVAIAGVYYLVTAGCCSAGRPVSSSNDRACLRWGRDGNRSIEACSHAILWSEQEEYVTALRTAILYRSPFRSSVDRYLRYASRRDSPILWSYSRCLAHLCLSGFRSGAF